MRRWVISLVLVAAAATAMWIGVRPHMLVERALDSVPAPDQGVVTEDFRRRGDGCGQLLCPQRLRIFTVATSASELCDAYARLVPPGARLLHLAEIGTARCGWVFDDEPVLVGVIVEDPPGATELVISARLVGAP